MIKKGMKGDHSRVGKIVLARMGSRMAAYV
jgi:hypothetical protein